MRARPLYIFALFVLACLPVGAEGPSVSRDLSPAAVDAVQRGLRWLAVAQNRDGSWLTDGETGRFPTAMTALGGLALLASGSTTYSGPYAIQVRRATEYLLRQADPQSGLIGGDEGGRPMFGHGYCLLFLAEVYGSESQSPLRARIEEVLRGGVRLSVSSQNELGGWFYQPDSDQDEGAVTITQMQGLRACANAGIPVPERAVLKARDYIRLGQNPDGGIAYRASIPGESRPGVTAAAVATLFASGIYEGDLVEGALAYARANVPLRAPAVAGGGHFYYSHLYLSQALYSVGDDAWRDYFRAIQEWLLEVQGPDGAWQGDYIGKTYGTAVALLILQLPENNLPLFQP